MPLYFRIQIFFDLFHLGLGFFFLILHFIFGNCYFVALKILISISNSMIFISLSFRFLFLGFHSIFMCSSTLIPNFLLILFYSSIKYLIFHFIVLSLESLSKNLLIFFLIMNFKLQIFLTLRFSFWSYQLLSVGIQDRLILIGNHLFMTLFSLIPCLISKFLHSIAIFLFRISLQLLNFLLVILFWGCTSLSLYSFQLFLIHIFLLFHCTR